MGLAPGSGLGGAASRATRGTAGKHDTVYCRIVDTAYAGTFSRISQKNTKTLRNVIRKGQHPTCSCHVPCLAWLPGCVAACKTELTRLQLPGRGGGLELVVVLQCCVLLLQSAHWD